SCRVVLGAECFEIFCSANWVPFASELAVIAPHMAISPNKMVGCPVHAEKMSIEPQTEAAQPCSGSVEPSVKHCARPSSLASESVVLPGQSMSLVGPAVDVESMSLSGRADCVAPEVSAKLGPFTLQASGPNQLASVETEFGASVYRPKDHFGFLHPNVEPSVKHCARPSSLASESVVSPGQSMSPVGPAVDVESLSLSGRADSVAPGVSAKPGPIALQDSGPDQPALVAPEFGESVYRPKDHFGFLQPDVQTAFLHTPPIGQHSKAELFNSLSEVDPGQARRVHEALFKANQTLPDFKHSIIKPDEQMYVHQRKSSGMQATPDDKNACPDLPKPGIQATPGEHNAWENHQHESTSVPIAAKLPMLPLERHSEIGSSALPSDVNCLVQREASELPTQTMNNLAEDGKAQDPWISRDPWSQAIASANHKTSRSSSLPSDPSQQQMHPYQQHGGVNQFASRKRGSHPGHGAGSLYKMFVKQGTTVGQVAIAEGNLLELPEPVRTLDAMGLHLPVYREVFDNQIILFEDGTKPHLIQSPFMDNMSRHDALWSQQGWVACDEMKFYLQMIGQPNLTNTTPPVIVPQDEDGPRLIEEWLTIGMDKIGAGHTSFSLHTACLFNQHWFPISALFNNDEIKVTTTLTDLPTLKNWIQVSLGFDVLFQYRVPIESFPADCGFQTIAAIMAHDLADSRAYPMSSEDAIKWRQQFANHLANQGTADRFDYQVQYGGVAEPLVTELSVLLQAHGVKAERVGELATHLIQTFGKQSIQQTLGSARPWADLKAKASAHRPPIKLVLTEELQSQIHDRLQTGKQIGNKKNKQNKRASQTTWSAPRASEVQIPNGIFQQSDGSPLNQITLHQMQLNQKGVAVVNIEDALPFLHLQKPISAEGIGMLVLDFHDQALPACHQIIRFPASCAGTQEPMILTAALLQLGMEIDLDYGHPANMQQTCTPCTGITPDKNGLVWIAHASEPPNFFIFTMQHGDVLISEVQSSKPSAKRVEGVPVASARTLRHLNSSAMVAANVSHDISKQDPLQLNDPWAGAAKGQSARSTSITPSQMASMENNVEKRLRATFQQQLTGTKTDDAPMDAQVDTRVTQLEQQVSSLTDNLNQLTGSLSSFKQQQQQTHNAQVVHQVQALKQQAEQQDNAIRSILDQKMEARMCLNTFLCNDVWIHGAVVYGFAHRAYSTEVRNATDELLQVELSAICLTVHAEVRWFEKMLQTDLITKAKNNRVLNPNKVFQDFAKPSVSPVCILLDEVASRITEVDHDDNSITLDRQSKFWDGELITQAGPATPIIICDDKVWLDSIDGLVPGQPVRQERFVGQLNEMFNRFQHEWQKRWDRHLDVPDEQWSPLTDFFCLARPPAPEMTYTPITRDLWTKTLKRKKPRAKGPDGWTRQDLLQLPLDLTDAILDMLHGIEAGTMQWPRQSSSTNLESMGPSSDFHGETVQYQRYKVACDVASRQTFVGLANCDAAFTLENMTPHARDRAIMRSAMNGTFYTADHLKHRDTPGDT
ncbi:unnamed protein product, partial [Cladocopium goreaui]